MSTGSAAPADSRAPSSAALWALVLCFAASGFAALIYELVWFQLLQYVVGSTAISLGILLATYMGGLCLGSLFAPRLSALRIAPLRLYALVELGIATLGLLVLFEIPLLNRLYVGSGTHGPWGVVVRACIAGVCLLPPTILMGAALPIAARWVEERQGGVSRGVSWLGVLYASNLVGAIAGCLFAGFYLLRFHDLFASTYVAAATNVLVASLAFVLARGTSASAADHRAVHGTSRHMRSVCAAIGLSGLCALGAEVVWTRLLALLVGPTVYTFAIILAVFLLGLALGGAVGASRVKTCANPRRELALCQLMLVAAMAWAAYMLNRTLPYLPIAPELAPDPWLLFQLDVARCLWVMLPSAMLWGASFPLALAAAQDGNADPSAVVAKVYGANTIGAIAGSLGFTFWVVPAFGTHAAQQLMIALSAAGGVLLLAHTYWDAREKRGLVGGLGAAVLAVAAGVVACVPPLPPELVAYGKSLATRLSARNSRTNAPADPPSILYMGEGLNESVAVSGNERVRVFHVSGKIEASTAPKDMRLQRMLGEIPALFHPAPRSVLIVGFGAGVTAGSFVVHPTVERIVICELEPLMPRKIAPYFRAENFDVVKDPRVEIVYDDARHYMLTARETFDVITSDPIHPWVKGSAALYSLEYFELVRRRLNPGGVVSQWVPLYQSSEATIQGEVATFFSAFPGGSVWANTDRGLGYDIVLLGSLDPQRLDLDALATRLARPDHAAVVKSLDNVGFRTATDLLLTYTGRAQELAPWYAGAPINRDRRLWLQYQAGMERFIEVADEIHRHMLAYRTFPEDLFVGSEERRGPLRGLGQRE